MSSEPSVDIDAFRRELRSWLDEHMRPDLESDALAQLTEDERVAKLRDWQAELASGRWVGINWPTAYGGRDAGIAEQVAYTEEMARAGAPTAVGTLGVGIVGPPLVAYGSAEQRERFARRILTGEDLWCCGFSEPGAGSDLASLRTTAELDGDEFVLNGQKVWTTLAHKADWCMVLCRTDPDARRAKGISCLLVDMKSPGISVRPLRQITGEADFNEVFFDNVRVPRGQLLGELNGGWTIATSALQNERGIMYVVDMQISLQQMKDRLVALARERGAGDSPTLRQEVAKLVVESEVFRMTCQRTLDKLLQMGMPGPEASIIKLHWTAITQGTGDLGMKLLGADALLYDNPEPGDVPDPRHQTQRSFLGARAASIASGTTEIMRGIIAMQVLGLPRGT